MPNEIDRTEVVIDTSLNDDQANKQISELEDRLNNLQKPRDIDLSFDKVYKRLEQIKFDLSEELSHKTLSQQRISNEDILRYQGISSLMKHMVEDRNSITPADLRDILESVELNLSSDTTSNIASQQNEAKDLDLSEIDRSISDAMGSFADQAATFKQLIHSYNVLAMKFNKMPTAAENSPALKEQYNALVSRIEQIIALMKEKFPGFQMPGKTDKGKYDLPYANKVDEFVKQLQNDLKPQQQQQPQSQKQDNTLGNIFRALVGVRTLFSLVRRIASQNEQLTTAVNNFMTTVANLLAPILNFLAAIINTIAGWLGRLFGVSSSTAKSSAATAAATKQLADFDEINNIGGSSGGGGGAGGAGKKPGSYKWLEDLLDGLLQMIKGIIEIIAGLIGAAFTGLITLGYMVLQAVEGVVGVVVGAVAGIVNGTIEMLKAYYSGLWTTIKGFFSDIWNIITGVFTGFIEGFNKARDEGHNILTSIFLGIWNSLTTTAQNIWKLIVDLFTNIWNTIKNTFTGFVNGFKTGFETVYGWFKKNLMDPLGENIKRLYNNFVKPCLDLISKGWNNVKNGFRNVMNGIIGFVNSAIRGLNKIPGVNIGTIRTLATGGFPNMGELFIANEAGPEMVGKIGNRNAVVNNQQIVDSVSKGVADAISSTIGTDGTQNINLYIDGHQIADVVVRQLNSQKRILGGSLV